MSQKRPSAANPTQTALQWAFTSAMARAPPPKRAMSSVVEHAPRWREPRKLLGFDEGTMRAEIVFIGEGLSAATERMFFFPALIAVFLLGVGIAALSLHAKRAINQVLAAVCFAGVLFFAAQLTAKYEAAKYLTTGVGSPLIWVRVKFAIVALISPTLVWLCFYVASGRYDNRRHPIRKMIPWMCLSGFLAALAFTQGFKPNDSLPGHERYGPLFTAFFGPMLIGQLAVCIASIGVAGRLTGLRR